MSCSFARQRWVGRGRLYNSFAEFGAANITSALQVIHQVATVLARRGMAVTLVVMTRRRYPSPSTGSSVIVKPEASASVG